jgi:hypothetical protein
MRNILEETIKNQFIFEEKLDNNIKKDRGIFLTGDIEIIDSILDIIKFDADLLNKKILEPAVGNGIFLLRTIEKLYEHYPNKEKIQFFIENCLYFIDIDEQMVEKTKENISNLYEDLFNQKYTGSFNGFTYDFTEKIISNLDLFTNNSHRGLKSLVGNVDYVIGNPPYVTLYGRRDRKKNEQQRINYLSQYEQFPKNLKNGKLNYVMLFLEHGLDFLKIAGKMAYIIDISFFETAYQHTRKYLLENTKILEIENNIAHFDGVASGQLIIKLEKQVAQEHIVKVKNFVDRKEQNINQKKWLNEKDEYKFRFTVSDEVNNILLSIEEGSKKLIDQHPDKSLRTATMLLDMEDKFVSEKESERKNCRGYRYYQGSKSVYSKYCNPFFDKYFFYDKKLQDEINDELKIELIEKGIKNKKRIGLGDFIVYNNPKIFIRQSAKELISTYDENLSSANNSLYVFSLKDNKEHTKEYLRFLCGYLNSEIATFYSQKMEIIRYRKGKQPQIKISDLYSLPVPTNKELIKNISNLVNRIYSNKENKGELENKINKTINDYFSLSFDEVSLIKKSISNFLKS